VSIPATNKLTGLSVSDEIVVEFERIDGQIPAPDALPFTDVAKQWYYDAVKFVYENGVMSGTDATTFAPDMSLTRAMLVQMLYSLDGSTFTGSSGFADVGGEWFADSVAWAVDKEITGGISSNQFNPNGAVTREQMALMLYSYCQYKGITLPSIYDASGITDADSINSWATEAVVALYRAGILSGRTGGAFDPQGTASRAEVAQMFMSFMNAID
jgi:hypothetical protein